VGDGYNQAVQTALTKFACLECRKVFKRPVDATRRTCPHCGSDARRVGSDFKAPPMRDDKGWEVASFLIRQGFPYYRLGVPYPTNMSTAEAFVGEHADKAVSQ
jgi:hypothetical protein